MSAFDLAAFWARAVWTFAVKPTWDGLPGPWWARVVLVAVCLACPGPADELLLISATSACRAWRARRAASNA